MVSPRLPLCVSVLVIGLSAGCADGDLCVPEADSLRVVHVQPPTRPGPDNSTVVDTFHTIQSALDAVGGGRGRATVCVADGTYYEELVVPADTHLVAAGAVRVRPPQTRETALPTDVDRVLLTLESGIDGPIVIDGLDVRRGGLCIDATGDGEALLRDMTVVDCAVGLRGRGGVSLTLHELTLDDHSIRAIDLVASSLRTESRTTMLRNGRPALGHEQTELTVLSSELSWTEDLASGRGTIIAVDSDVTLDNTSIDESEYERAVVHVTGGSLSLRGVQIGAQRSADNMEGFVAGESGGDGPIITARDASVVVDGLRARSEGQGLFALVGSSLVAHNVDWSGRGPTTSDGAVGPALDVVDGGTVQLWHASLLGPQGAPGIRFSGSEVITLDFANNVLWGHLDGEGFVVDGAQPELDVRYSLVQDSTVTGAQMVPSADPLWDDAPDGLLIPFGSPARCRGAGNLAVNADLLGNLRPFEPGKAPDLGAIELQEACP